MMEHRNEQRLAIFLAGLYGGGAERTMLNLAQGIAERGYRVDLVLAQAEGPYLSQVPDSVRMVDLSAGRRIASFRTLIRLPALMRYLRRERPDALLSALSQANMAAVVARRLTGEPQRLVVNVQNTLSRSAPESPDFLVRMTPKMAKYVFHWADNVVGVSQGVADDLVKSLGLPKQKVTVIHNPGITPQVQEKAQRPVDHPWFQPGEPPVILAVGSLTKQKDFGTLTRAFAQVRKRRPARLLILGEGCERTVLENLTRELGVEADVSLPGFVDNPYAYMSRAGVFVLSSRWEGLPTVLVEALYCCPALVATDCPSGPREILQDGRLGHLVPMQDPATLAAAIDAALDGKGPRKSHDGWQPYALDTVIDQYVDMLLRV